MILGPIMIATGLSGLAGMEIVYPIYKHIKGKKSKKNVPEEESEEDLTTQYTRFFENLGIMDSSKGDWIVVKGDVEKHDFYSRVTFVLSDTLSVEKFQKHCENIRQKLQVVILDIYEEKGKMIFRSRMPELPTVPYVYEETPNKIVPLGVDLDKAVVSWDMKKDPHLMIAGSSNCGKSTMHNIIINHLIRNVKGCKLYLIDLKYGLEFGFYKDVKNVVSYAKELESAKQVIADFEAEADRRYTELAKEGCRNFYKYVEKRPNTSMKHAFLIIDEFADLMSLNGGKDEYDAIETLVNLSRKCRAVGMHLVIASQRATTDSMPSSMKANITCILGMKTNSEHNSRLIIEENGLEKLKMGECIGIINSEKIFFKGYLLKDEEIEATAKEFDKGTVDPKQVQQTNVIKVLK